MRPLLRLALARVSCSRHPPVSFDPQALSSFRRNSTNGRPSVPQHETPPKLPSVLIEDNFAQYPLFAVGFLKRFVKISCIGLVVVGVTAWTAFEASHMWVEHMELSREIDEEIERWEWNKEAEKWTGGENGGTDRDLGFKGRLAVRAAWMTQNWGVGDQGPLIGSDALHGHLSSGTGGLRAVEASLEYGNDFLNIALAIAEKKVSAGQLKPETLTTLITRHASILERMGTADAIFESRSQYERVWSSLPGKGIDAARTALKLGDLNRRLGDPEDALAWWSRAIYLTQPNGAPSDLSTPLVPDAFPSSPLAQRTLTSALVSLSAFYATSGQLLQAQALEEASLALLRSLPYPDSLASSTPPQALHHLYLLHRSSLISIHLAEVLYALRTPGYKSVQWLTNAAESSERVALFLSGLPSSRPETLDAKMPRPPFSKASLLPAYAGSKSMSKPASSLLRDARRTAAEAWNLIGVLSESSADNGNSKHSANGDPKRALQCYERALGWAGVVVEGRGGVEEAGEVAIEEEWKALWRNYVRVRELVRKQPSDS